MDKEETFIPRIPYAISKENLENLSAEAKTNLDLLSKTVLEGLNPPAGAYAFFNHISHALSRIKDIGMITDRLYEEINALIRLSIEEQRIQPNTLKPGEPYPEPYQVILSKSSEINEYAELDMESLYIFGQVLLDQWGLIAAAVGGLKLKGEHPFVELVKHFEETPTSPLKDIWDGYKSQILWLHYQIRFYRNRFIIHANRPWQRGSTRTSLGEEFNLFIPSPPGWLDDEKLDEEIRKLLPLTPPRIKNAPDDYWEKARPGRIIEVLFDGIGEIENTEDRKRISELFGKIGGSTPTFQIILKNLLQFIAGATELLNKIAEGNLDRVNLGKPNKTSDDLWRERD